MFARIRLAQDWRDVGMGAAAAFAGEGSALGVGPPAGASGGGHRRGSWYDPSNSDRLVGLRWTSGGLTGRGHRNFVRKLYLTVVSGQHQQRCLGIVLGRCCNAFCQGQQFSRWKPNSSLSDERRRHLQCQCSPWRRFEGPLRLISLSRWRLFIWFLHERIYQATNNSEIKLLSRREMLNWCDVKICKIETWVEKKIKV